MCCMFDSILCSLIGEGYHRELEKSPPLSGFVCFLIDSFAVMDLLTAFKRGSSGASIGNKAAAVLFLMDFGDLDSHRFLPGFITVRRLHHTRSQTNIQRFGYKSELATAARIYIGRRKLGYFSSSVVGHLRLNINISSSPRSTISYVEVGW